MGPVFDFEDGDFIFSGPGGMGFDMDGDLFMRLGDNMSLGLNDGEIHFHTPWPKDDDDLF